MNCFKQTKSTERIQTKKSCDKNRDLHFSEFYQIAQEGNDKIEKWRRIQYTLGFSNY